MPSNSFDSSLIVVETFSPGPTFFVLDISLLDGTDTLRDTGTDYTWQAITSSTANISIDNGFEIGDGIVPILGGSSALIQLTSETYDPFTDKKLKPNFPIRVRYDDYTIFYGIIDSLGVQIIKDAPANQVVLQCIDHLEYGMRMTLALTGDTEFSGNAPDYMAEFLAGSVAASMLTGNYSYYQDLRGTPVTTMDTGRTTVNPMGDTMSGIFLGELGGIFVTQDYITYPGGVAATWITYMRSAFTNAEAIYTDTIEDEITDIEFSYNDKLQPNSFIANLDTGTTTKTAKNTTSIGLNGEISAQYYTRLANSTQLTSFVEALAAVPNAQLVATNVSTVVYDSTAWLAYGRKPGTAVKVIWDSYTDYFIINKARHEITPDYWTVSYDLWKGL